MKRFLLSLATVSLCASALMAQWNSDPYVNNQITPAGQKLYSWDFKVNRDEMTFLHFNAPTGNNTNTYLQIIDRDGSNQIEGRGLEISTERTRSYTMVNKILSVDTDGNALLAVSDCRNAASESNDLSYTVYKVSPTGEMLWGVDGLDLEKGRANSFEACFNMVQRADGNYVFAWMKDNGDLHCIQIECISKEGEFLWDESIILKDNTTSYSYPYLVDAGNSQVILVYAKGSNLDIMARKLDFDGSQVWEEDTRIYRGGFPNVPLHTILEVTPDPNGGVFVGWYDDRFFTNYESAYVSYVKSDGKLAFSAGIEGQPVGISDNIRKFGPKMTYDPTQNCLYAVWRETSSGQSWQGLKMQKIAMTGELLWDSEGLFLFPMQEEVAVGYYSVQPATDGDITAFFMTMAGYNEVTGYAARINGDGDFVWPEETIMFTAPMSAKGSLTSSELIHNSHWLTMWSDERGLPGENESCGKIFAQRINTDGSLGISAAIRESAVNSGFDLKAYAEEGNILFATTTQGGQASLNLYSVSGQKATTVFKGTLNAGSQNISWDNTLAPGIYIATLSTAEGTKSVRVIVK